jgi:hypothetical protein
VSKSPDQSQAQNLTKFDLPSIEGERIRFDAQQLKPAGPPKPIKGQTGNFHHLVGKTSARAVVTGAYEPKRSAPKTCLNAKMELGSEIAGKTIAAFSKSFSPIVRGDASVASGKHPRQVTNLSDGAVAIVLSSSFGITLPVDPRKVLQIEPQSPP